MGGLAARAKLALILAVAWAGQCEDCSSQGKIVMALTSADQLALREEECNPPQLAEVTTSDGDDQSTRVCRVLNSDVDDEDVRVEGTQQVPDPWLEVKLAASTVCGGAFGVTKIQASFQASGERQETTDLEAFVGLTRCGRVAAWPGATRVNFTCAGEGDRITVKRMRPEGSQDSKVSLRINEVDVYIEKKVPTTSTTTTTKSITTTTTTTTTRTTTTTTTKDPDLDGFTYFPPPVSGSEMAWRRWRETEEYFRKNREMFGL